MPSKNRWIAFPKKSQVRPGIRTRLAGRECSTACATTTAKTKIRLLQTKTMIQLELEMNQIFRFHSFVAKFWPISDRNKIASCAFNDVDADADADADVTDSIFWMTRHQIEENRKKSI